ncbi:hypothetical protein BJL95_07870 [Methylomonas sp. LWB]|uniref:P-loop NTPase fold protein n=1 Tax=Methylomonas sp. LWB TaxID=1905845 RepID=UPI0008D8F69B|nr:P-loop NTPase fold protein [Methylomonas sp. LWB]OHX37709.1 hypothetical protein BJL95_07870 [Methylomonas sp. LWB]
MSANSGENWMAELGFSADSELQKALEIAAHIGDVSEDDANISYTSLLIGLLWNGDALSVWLQAQIQRGGVAVENLYRQRRLTEAQREPILENVRNGRPAASRKVAISISARTVLQEAHTLALETGCAGDAPLATRHVLAAYFFRNPPGHNHQLHQEWGFEAEVWRSRFAEYIHDHYSAEFGGWAQVLSGYLDTDDLQPSGQFLGGYAFDTQTVQLLRTLEQTIASHSPPLFSSASLLDLLVSLREVPDCATFAELVAIPLKIGEPRTLTTVDSPFAGSGSSFSATHGFKNILDRARTLARAISGTEIIGVRHIIASLLVSPDSTANKTLKRVGVSLPLLRNRVLGDFTRRWVNDDGLQWRFHLIGTTPPTIAGYSSDSADTGIDKLDVARYATAFAVVVAAEQVRPPLSIGIFGDWGAGKSFFMRLISEQTERLCANSTLGPDGKRLFCRRILSIRFNAWHYAEQDLWASLVQTIFQELNKALLGPSDASDVLASVQQDLNLAKEARAEAENQLNRARDEQDDRNNALQAVRQQARLEAEKVRALSAVDVVAAVNAEVITDQNLERLLVLAEDYLGYRGIRQDIREGRQTVSALMDIVRDSRSATGKVRSALSWLSRAPISKNEFRKLTVVAILVLVVVSLFATVFRDWIGNAWAMLSTLLAELGAVGGMAIAWAKRHLKTVSEGLSQFDNLSGELDRRLAAKHLENQADLLSAEEAFRQSQAKLANAEASLLMAIQNVEQAEQAVAESRSAQRIARLVEQRLSGRNYEQYLGIVAAIRADFQTLSDLMKQMRRESESAPTTPEPIDRIVLYIDDLDRCPSDRVVAVLEAIHLMLAFELFVVVVGVDIRWAARSLAEKYPNHLTPGDEQCQTTPTALSRADIDGATALDYLEKIFQIPFWLPPMEEQASRNLIFELLPAPVGQAGVESGHNAAEQKPADLPAADQQAATSQAAHLDAAKAQPSPTPKGAELLDIAAEERNYMLRLAGAVGKSPRRLKRFVNTYRILKASIDALERETFVLEHGANGEYRTAMTLLALVTGAPRSSLDMLRFLDEHRDEDAFQLFDDYLRSLIYANEAKYVLGALTAYRTTQPTNLRELRHWAPLVARFSFRSGTGM